MFYLYLVYENPFEEKTERNEGIEGIERIGRLRWLDSLTHV